MARIGSLLGIVEIKKADGLVLATDQVPALIVDGARQALTMPPLSASTLEAAVEELLTPAERAQLGGAGAVEGVHDAGALGAFALRVQVAGDTTTVTLTRGGSAPPARVGPAAAAVPAPSDDAALVAVLDQSIARRASDVLLSTGRRPMLRVDGEWHELAAAAVVADVEGAFRPRLSEQRRQAFADTGSVDLAFAHPVAGGEPVRFRVNLFRQQGGVAAALRPLWTAPGSLAELGLPAALLPVMELPHGLVVMTGATGSGKSTTLAALLEHVNATRARHVVTLEDPIEYVFRPRRAIIHQREIGAHVDGFASGLRAALRESPDVILLGEMRDPETIRLALTAAETGHLVVSTLHSGTCAMAIDRIVDVFGEAEKGEVRQQLAGALRHVIGQRLLPAVGGGRVPVLEMLTVTAAVAAQIREGRTHMLASQMEIEAGERMVTLERALASLVRAGRLERQVALDATQRRDELRKLLERPAAAAARR